MEYQPFSQEWEKDMNKIPKKQLEVMFNISSEGLSKKQHIKIIRANLIVKKFNEDFSLGSKVGFMSIANDKNTGKIVTVKSEAFMSHGNPVVFFNEISGYCSIEPEFLF